MMDGVIGQVNPTLIQVGGAQTSYRTPTAMVLGPGAIAIGPSAEAFQNAVVIGGWGAYVYGTAVGRGSGAFVYGTAIGASAVAYGAESTAIGADAFAAERSIAVGRYAYTAASDAIAIGHDALTSIPGTAHIAALPIVPPGEGAGNWYTLYTAARVVMFSADRDLTVAGDTDMTLPAGLHLWIDEIGVICIGATGIVTQPTVRFGTIANRGDQLAPVMTTALTGPAQRERYTPLRPDRGETNVSAGVTVPANATAMWGRFYWAGFAVMDPV